MNTTAAVTARTKSTVGRSRTRKVKPSRPAVGASYDNSTMRLRFGDTAEDPDLVAARMSLQPDQDTSMARQAMAAMREKLTSSCRAKMAAYIPDLPAEHVQRIRSFVEDAVALALPQTSYSVETLLRPAMHFAYWAVFVIGADLDSKIVFNRKLIEHYVRETMPELTEGTRRNYRAWLFRVAEAVNPEANPRNPMPLNARALDTPYTPEELDALDRWATVQNTNYRRQAAAVLLALGAGAGLTAREIVAITGESITVEDDCVMVRVDAGKRSRDVVVTARYEETLKKAAQDCPAGAFVFLPKRTRVDNAVVSAFVGGCTAPPKRGPAVHSRKLRNTWLVGHMSNRVDVYTLMQAAGLQSLETISRLAYLVPRPTEQDRINQLRGVR